MSRSSEDSERSIASLESKGGTIDVYDGRIQIERTSRSMFESKEIPLTDVIGVEYSNGFLTGHLQVLQADLQRDFPGFISHPIDENTLHFPRSHRDGAHSVRDAITERVHE